MKDRSTPSVHTQLVLHLRLLAFHTTPSENPKFHFIYCSKRKQNCYRETLVYGQNSEHQQKMKQHK